MIAEAGNFITTLESSPAFATDVAVLASVLPASIVAEAASNPDALIDNLAENPTAAAALLSAIPTTVLDSLETLLAKPIKALGDVEGYVDSVLQEPGASSVISVLMTAVPTPVQESLESDPVGFVANLITTSALPTWVTDISAPLQSDIGSVLNKALSLIDADLEGTGVAAPMAASTGFFPTVVVKPTGSGGGVVTGPKPTGSPITFVAGAAPVRTAAAGTALFAGFCALLML